MKDMFHVTNDERELIIECIEKEIEETEPLLCKEFYDQTYVVYAECKINNLKSIIRRMRDYL